MSEPVGGQAVRPARGLMWTVVLLLLAAAGLLWAASTVPWFDGTGSPAAARDRPTGADQVPALIPLALLSLAGIAGAVATAGALRRVVGGLLALLGAGGIALWLGYAATVTAAGPLLGLAGLAPLLAAGLIVLVGGARMPALGARYDTGSNARAADPDREVWEALDSGSDPTVTARKDP
ncbi:Trp biosynthesis-associated membrane protein [Allokutzneria sp. A3M-2-11 16]|uniref:Trp biosynthesis-associated membrane protein n=1 Tax=Allokutzneria sp. A3M-2-11 16 TaxID=2962043 RepID=UPI0020B6838C|nr:Trp biosynthesis-associated membrane protein [Allokutzneria sp. A3M-2-11 16]MCP3797681.1 Trp biosynthesis-associated membrane protein [Allokutzneria sp. A3M-2-11 16]